MTLQRWQKNMIFKCFGIHKKHKRLLGIDYSNGTDLTCEVKAKYENGKVIITDVRYYPLSVIKANPVLLEFYQNHQKYTNAKRIMLRKKKGYKL
jgi:hypothetical protein